MRLRLRLLLVIISSLWRKPMGPFDESVLNLRVLPNDVDVTRVTTDRYTALAELGRIDWMLRVGLFRTMLKRRWAPVSRINTIRFRYPLRLFQKYQLRSRVVYWDDTWAYFEHHFQRKGRTIALSYGQGVFRGPQGLVPTGEALTLACSTLFLDKVPFATLATNKNYNYHKKGFVILLPYSSTKRS